MAIINNNVGNVKFLRNGSLFATREAARIALETNKTLGSDGTMLFARYSGETATDVKTLAGLVWSDGTNYSITIIDIEGGSADVEALREEVNAKLGTGVTSANTVTAQLAALSGNSATDTSATTSVEGAKKYAYDLIGTLDYTGSAETGSYVSKVDQVDGKISATLAALPSVTGTPQAKKVVIAVSEDKGTVSDTKGTISSSAETIVLTDNADGGVNFEVNIDNDTIVQDETTKKLKVASAALTQYVGDGKTIQISNADANNNKTVSTLIQLSSTTVTETNVREQFNLVNASGETIGATIKIYKDSSLYTVYIGHVDDTLSASTDPTSVVTGSGDTALCFIYHKEDGTYELVPVNVESFLEETEFGSGVTATNHVVHGVVDSTSEKDSNNDSFLTVGSDGFKIDGIKDEIDKRLGDVVSGLDATVTATTSGSHITVSIEELDGKLVQSGFSITEDNIANADDLAGLSAKTVTEIASSNSSISATSSATADGTVKYDIVTDASKIKMSGFTADTNGFSAITESSSVTEAVKVIETEVIANEQVTAQALNDINTRLGEIEGEGIKAVKVNNVALAETDNAVNVQINGSSSAMSGANAVIVQTDNSTGAVTIGLGTIDCGTY